MKYTNIRGRKLSAMTLGTVQLGLNYGINNDEGKPSHEKSFSMLDAALNQGITSLDTARAYGDSELILGDFFMREWHASMPVLTTKTSINLPDGTSSSQVETAMTNSIEESLERLGVHKVDYYLLHNASDMTRFGDAVPQTLKRLMKKGYFTTPGVSVYYAHEIETMLENPLYCAVQLPMGVLDQRLVSSGHMQRLMDNSIDVFVRSVFMQGLCFMDPNCDNDELRLCAGPHIKKLREFSEKAGMSTAQFAVSFIRDMPGVTSLVLGADNPAQVRQDIELLSGPPIPEGILQQAFESFSDIDYEGIMAVLRRAKPQDEIRQENRRKPNAKSN